MGSGDTTDDRIILDVKDGYGILTINRPEKRNAVDRETQQLMWARLNEAKDHGLKVIVITGAGDVSFCAGADLKDTGPAVPPTSQAPTTWAETQRRIAEHPAVIIAAVNGYALGGGLTLVNNADLAVASSKATFGIPEINYGIYASLAGPSTVQRVAPKHVAKLVLTGERIDAEEAYRVGLVNEVVEPDSLMARAEDLATSIAKFDGLALDVAKAAMRAEQHMTWNDALMHGSWSTSFISSARSVGGPQ